MKRRILSLTTHIYHHVPKLLRILRILSELTTSVNKLILMAPSKDSYLDLRLVYHGQMVLIVANYNLTPRASSKFHFPTYNGGQKSLAQLRKAVLFW